MHNCSSNSIVVTFSAMFVFGVENRRRFSTVCVFSLSQNWRNANPRHNQTNGCLCGVLYNPLMHSRLHYKIRKCAVSQRSPKASVWTGWSREERKIGEGQTGKKDRCAPSSYPFQLLEINENALSNIAPSRAFVYTKLIGNGKIGEGRRKWQVITSSLPIGFTV